MVSDTTEPETDMYGIFRGEVKLANQIHLQKTFKTLKGAQKHADQHEWDRVHTLEILTEWKAKHGGDEVSEHWHIPVVAAPMPTE